VGEALNLRRLSQLLFLASILYFRVKPIEVFDGPDLALAILVFQGLGHFVVDSGQSQSNMKMASIPLNLPQF
jgi:hypothetical protein